MSVIAMTRSTLSTPTPGAGAFYHNEISISAGSESDIYTLPLLRRYAHTYRLVGDGTLEVSNDSYAKLEADTATFVTWDGTSEISLAITAFRVTRVSGTVTVVASVFTETV